MVWGCISASNQHRLLCCCNDWCDLLDCVSRLFCCQINQEMSKPKLAPLNEGGVSELLNKVKKKNAVQIQFELFFIIIVQC